MSDEVKYDATYREGRNVCGEPLAEFIQFFQALPHTNVDVLDLGAGQGRDTLPIAQMGHRVTAVDVSKVGLDQLKEEAEGRKLPVTIELADIREFQTDAQFDVVILNRVLHLLDSDAEREAVVENVVKWLRPEGFLLISETKVGKLKIRRTIQALEALTITYDMGLSLFARRVNA